MDFGVTAAGITICETSMIMDFGVSGRIARIEPSIVMDFDVSGRIARIEPSLFHPGNADDGDGTSVVLQNSIWRLL